MNETGINGCVAIIHYFLSFTANFLILMMAEVTAWFPILKLRANPPVQASLATASENILFYECNELN